MFAPLGHLIGPSAALQRLRVCGKGGGAGAAFPKQNIVGVGQDMAWREVEVEKGSGAWGKV
jgi:hypothetical protein